MLEYVKLITKEEFEIIMKYGKLDDTPFDGVCSYSALTHELFINKIYANGSAESEILGFNMTFHGKTGTWAPVLRIKPVFLDGANLSKVKAGPYKNLVQRGLGKGAKVEIIRSNKVIPKVNKVLERSEDLSEVLKCSCGGELTPFGADLVCKNPECKENLEWIKWRFCNAILGGEKTSYLINQSQLNYEGIKHALTTYEIDLTKAGLKEIGELIGTPRFNFYSINNYEELNKRITEEPNWRNKLSLYKECLKTGLHRLHFEHVKSIVEVIYERVRSV